MLELMLQLVVILLASIPLHELGHWIVAKRLGWEPSIKQDRWGFKVITKEVEIEDVNEFPKLYQNLVQFRAAGSLFSLITISVAQLFHLFPMFTFAGLVLLFTFYGWWEVMNNPFGSVKNA